MKQMNIYQEFLQYCSPRTEEDIVSIEQLDYQNGRYNDFNAPSKQYTLAEYRAEADRIFDLYEFLNYQYRPGLDARVKIYVYFNNGGIAAFEILYGDDGMAGGWSTVRLGNSFR